MERFIMRTSKTNCINPGSRVGKHCDVPAQSFRQKLKGPELPLLTLFFIQAPAY